jgi:hypothetical protein
LFGNEDKVGWDAFWKFALQHHPTLNRDEKTFITDQAKGLVDSVKALLNNASHFHCSYHRMKNILTHCKGGKKTFSGHWLYQKLIGAKTKADVDRIRNEHVLQMSDRVLKYLATVADDAQYPACRVAKTEHKEVYMYRRTASSSVESMNRANKAARDKTAVDVVQALKLLIDLETSRFLKKKADAWNHNETLTPHGIKLRDEIFGNVDFHDYTIDIAEHDDSWVRQVTKTRMMRTAWFPKEADDMGSFFGGCNCGIPNVDAVPCHHMVAVVKCGRVKSLTPNNVMPRWWTTEMWRKQYPAALTSLNDFSLETLKLTEQPDKTMKYCPPFVAPNKTGRPSQGQRIKGPLEETKPKKMRNQALHEAMEKSKKGKKSRKKSC